MYVCVYIYILCVVLSVQERQLQVQTKARESVLSEMSGVETKYQTVLAQVCSTTEQMAHLEANGEHKQYVLQSVYMASKTQKYIGECVGCMYIVEGV